LLHTRLTSNTFDTRFSSFKNLLHKCVARFFRDSRVSYCLTVYDVLNSFMTTTFIR